MNSFYKSIILVIIAFMAVVGFTPQAKAGVDAVTAATCLNNDPAYNCIEGEDCIKEPGEVVGICVPSTGETCSDTSDCAADEECVDEVCVPSEPECATGTDCDDGVYCNGLETCVEGECILGTDPCEPDICIEADEECVECEYDLDCADDETCEDNVCESVCSYPPKVKDFDDDENCYLSKDELKAAKTFYKDEHKKQKDDLKLSQGEDKAFLKSLKEYAE